MKKLVTIAIAALAGHLLAGTYTWTGANGDGLWFTAGNWNYDGAAATSSPGNTLNGDNVVIDGSGVVVTYVPGGDLITQAGTTLTVSNGATLKQDGGAWPLFYGNVVIDGGTLDFKNNATNPDQVRLEGRLVLQNGGQLFCNQLVKYGDARVVIGEGITYTVDGTVGGDASTLYQEMAGGTLYIGNEFQAKNGNEYTGTGTINCNIFSPQTSGSVVTFNGPNLILRTTSNDGFWQLGGTYINVPTGSKSKFTIPAGFHTVNDVYTKTFGSSATTPKFRYNDTILTEYQFAELFTVEAHAESIDGNYYYTDFYLTPSGAEPITFANSVTATMTSDSSATLAVTVDGAGSPSYTLYALYGKSNGGKQIADWENVVEIGVGTDGLQVSQPIAVESGYVYYYGIVASNENGNVWATAATPGFFALLNEPASPTNVWRGTISTDSREAANWSLGHVPTSGEYVYVLDRLYDVQLDWYSDTGDGVVAGWIQPDAFLNNGHQVFFHTSAESPLTITGDVVFGGGTWTHSGPSETPAEMLNISVGGTMSIGSNARIVVGTSSNANNGDGLSRGYTAGHGPGYLRTAGGSYAGEGGHITNTTGFVSYGSILDPVSHGSGGWGDSSGYAGGGVIRLVVAGALTVNGSIMSRGFGYALNNDYVGGAGSGGSVNITAASLAGSGSIDANGGNNGLYGPGSGGRIKVELTSSNATFDDFAGTIQALGGSMESENSPTLFDVSPAAAGTVCLQTAGANPVVKVYNEFRYGNTIAPWRVASGEAIPSATHLPSMQDGDRPSVLKHTKWELSGHGALRLTRDVQIASLSLAAADGTQKVYTDGFKLTTPALVVNGSRFRSGTYTAETNPEFIVGDGSVTVGGSGFAVFVR